MTPRDEKGRWISERDMTSPPASETSRVAAARDEAEARGDAQAAGATAAPRAERRPSSGASDRTVQSAAGSASSGSDAPPQRSRVAALGDDAPAVAPVGGGGGGGGGQTPPRPPHGALPPLDASDRDRLLNGEHAQPHAILGAHSATVQGALGVVVRTLQHGAVRVELVTTDGAAVEMTREHGALFAVFLPGAPLPLRYRIRSHYEDGATWERDDAYRFLPTLGDVDLHLFAEGNHRQLWRVLGARMREVDGVVGVSFAVWAPNARRVSVVGDFCMWDGRIYPMRSLGASGVWELFIPEIRENALYKFEMLTREGAIRIKTDPYARKMQQAPETSSIVVRDDAYAWRDDAWMQLRPRRDTTREPMAIYEVHLGSWARVPEDGNRSLSYREIAPRLAEHCCRFGFTHVEFLPVSEHPFYGSWGYQVSGYYAPTSRYGSPEDFKFLVDTLHQAGLGVIVDWVPAHFPKDDYALRRFDGTALYEHEDPRLGEHPDWGTLIFNYARNEVRNFLVANALYWLKEFHVDGLRVDAVASMLYLDYSRKAGEWLRNRLGGRENLDAIDFLRQFNDVIHAEAPGCFTVAEESTSWPGVTKPGSEGGLGFTYKWNMGWMHDTLDYFETDPLYRAWHQDRLTFAMMYEYSERFIMPISHDEVVHLKKSVLGKMPGDDWQKFANLRALMAYQYTRPGKKLVFMGSEVAQPGEWNHDAGIDWGLEHQGLHGAFAYYMRTLGQLYRERPALWRLDADWRGFQWIDANDRENSVLVYSRRSEDEHVVVILNLTPTPRTHYRVGAPTLGEYEVILNTDAPEFGGSGAPTTTRVDSEAVPFHGYAQSMRVDLPPLAVVVLAPCERTPGDRPGGA